MACRAAVAQAATERSPSEALMPPVTEISLDGNQQISVP
jgi:hypothetical protein